MAHVVLEKRICEDILDRFSVLDLGTFRMSWQAEVLQNVVERRRASEFFGHLRRFRKSWKDKVLQKSWTASECLGKTMCFRMSWKDEVLQNVLDSFRRASECHGNRNPWQMS